MYGINKYDVTVVNNKIIAYSFYVDIYEIENNINKNSTNIYNWDKSEYQPIISGSLVSWNLNSPDEIIKKIHSFNLFK